MNGRKRTEAACVRGGRRVNCSSSSAHDILVVEILNLMTVFSPLGDVTLDAGPALHRVLESSQLVGVVAGRSAEVRFRGCFVF